MTSRGSVGWVAPLLLPLASCAVELDDASDDTSTEAIALTTLASPTALTTDTSLAAPRLVAPLSAATVTASRPTLRFTADGLGSRTLTLVVICADRACHDLVDVPISAGGAVKPHHPLAPGVYFWRAVRLIGQHPISPWSHTWSFRVPPRPQPSVDTAWGTFLDVNGDGYADAAVRTVNFNLPAHRFAVYLGGAAGLAASPATEVELTGDPPGVAIAAAGDLDGDGYGDLAVQHAGQVEVYAGSATGLSTTPRLIPTQIPEPTFAFADRVAAAGDVDGDGFGDLVVTDSFNGHIWIYRGAADGLATAPTWTIAAGPQESVLFVAAADFNGDRFGDIALTEFAHGSGTQSFRVLPGSPAGPPPRESVAAFDSGQAVFGSAGDVDADGYADLLLTERQIGVAIYHGGASGPAAPPDERIPSDAGGLFACLADFDGDGYDDVALTTSRPTDSFFFTLDRTAIHRGGAGGGATTPIVTLREEGHVGDIENNFGAPLSTADFDRDGRLDLLVSAAPPYPTPFFDSRPSFAFVFPGAAGGVATTAQPALSGIPGFGLGIAAGH